MAAFVPEGLILKGPRAPEGLGGGFAFLLVPFLTVGYFIAIVWIFSGVMVGPVGAAFLGGGCLGWAVWGGVGLG